MCATWHIRRKTCPGSRRFSAALRPARQSLARDQASHGCRVLCAKSIELQPRDNSPPRPRGRLRDSGELAEFAPFFGNLGYPGIFWDILGYPGGRGFPIRRPARGASLKKYCRCFVCSEAALCQPSCPTQRHENVETPEPRPLGRAGLTVSSLRLCKRFLPLDTPQFV